MSHTDQEEPTSDTVREAMLDCLRRWLMTNPQAKPTFAHIGSVVELVEQFCQVLHIDHEMNIAELRQIIVDGKLARPTVASDYADRSKAHDYLDEEPILDGRRPFDEQAVHLTWTQMVDAAGLGPQIVLGVDERPQNFGDVVTELLSVGARLESLERSRDKTFDRIHQHLECIERLESQVPDLRGELARQGTLIDRTVGLVETLTKLVDKYVGIAQ